MSEELIKIYNENNLVTNLNGHKNIHYRIYWENGKISDYIGSQYNEFCKFLESEKIKTSCEKYLEIKEVRLYKDFDMYGMEELFKYSSGKTLISFKFYWSNTNFTPIYDFLSYKDVRDYIISYMENPENNQAVLLKARHYY